MSIEPATLTMTGLIATGLSLIFAIAAHSTGKKRQRERAHLEATLRAQRPTSPSVRVEPAIPAAPVADVAAVRTQPAVAVTAERPRAVVPASEPPAAPAPVAAAAVAPAVAAAPTVASPARTPPASQGSPSLFKQYVTRPGTKTTTPVVETPPTDKDYVWE